MIISKKYARMCKSDGLASEYPTQPLATKGSGNQRGIAGVAIALGVGAAAFAGCGVAWADTDSSDSTASTAQRSDRNSNSQASDSSTRGRGSATRARIAANLGLTDKPAFKPQLPHDGGARQMPTAASTQTSKKAGAVNSSPIRGLIDRAPQTSVSIAPQPAAAQVSSADLITASAADSGPTDGQSGVRPVVRGVVPGGTSFAPTARSLNVNSTAAADILSRVISALSGRTPTGPTGDSPAVWTLLAAARRELSPTGASAVAADPVGPTLVVGDYDLVATTTLDVVSFYGAPVRFPAAPGTVQGGQNFDVKDSSGNTIGSVVALVDNTNSDSSYGGVYNEILVTDATYDSAEAAPLPVGSIVVNYDLHGFGFKYSSIPTTASGSDAVSFAWVTPFGDISIGHRIFELFDASEYLADNTLTSNVPVGLANGYYISAANPGTEDITAIAGVIPLFNCIQGEDTFAVYQDGTDTAVDGTFTGFVTTTKDLVGGYTELIIVTDTNGSTNVGTDPGQIPPVGSVLNVFHAWNLKTYVIYAAMPTDSGTDMYVAVATPWFTFNLPQKLVRLDATLPLSTALLPLNDGNSLEAISDLQVSGGNGLPPREMIYQGYQQFLYKDANGIPVESFDADVSSQTTPNGDSNVSILVTKVNASTGDPVLPVGSVINITYSMIPGFGTYYSSVPTDSGNVVTSQYVTPWGRIPKFTRYDASAGLAGYTYYTPF